MPKLEYIKELEEMDEGVDVETFSPAGENHTVVLLSEAATRELCLALDEHLDDVSPRNTRQQEAVDHLYNDILDRFKFKRGSYILSTGNMGVVPIRFLKSYTPDDADVWKEIRTTVIGTCTWYADQ